MSARIQVRGLTRGDLAFANILRAAAGWNQTQADWERFLELEPEGCFAATWNGDLAGTATTLIYGPELAWIGMVLVHPNYRRRGIGRSLLLHCIEHLRRRGIRCIKLDATPLGQPVYETLGFRPEWAIARWERAGAVGGAADGPEAVGNLDRFGLAPAQHWVQLDAAAFGIARSRLWGALARRSLAARFLKATEGGLAGIGLIRPGAQARYLGPVVAATPVEGLAIIEALLAEQHGKPVFWDIPEPNAPATAWAAAHGFHRQRPLTRMFLGENVAPGNPHLQFALAGPEVG